QAGIVVNPAAIGSFTVAGFSNPVVAGTAGSVVVTALDTFGNTKADYVGTIHFTSDDGAAVLPGDYTFVGGDSGAHTFTNAITLKTTGSKYIKAWDTADNTKLGQQAAITVNPAAISSFTVAGFSNPTTAGSAGTVTVTAYDAFSNVKTDYVGTIHFTSDDGAAVLPGDYTFVGGDSGAHTFTNAITLKTVGSKYIKVWDTADNTKLGQQAAITVNPAAISSFTVAGFSNPTTAGVAGSVTVTALDAFSNVKTDYVGIIHFTSDDGAAVLPGDYTFVGGDAGAHTFTNAITLKTTGSKYIKVWDTADNT